MSTMIPTNPWPIWRRELIAASQQAPDLWMDEDEVMDIQHEAQLEGITARTVMTCRRAEAECKAGGAQIPASHTKPRILVVEPDAVYARTLFQLLQTTSHYEVQVCAEVNAALHLCRSMQPDLIITEMALPKATNGTGLAHYARLVMQRHVPVIILEGALQSADVSIVSSRNALHLRKPVKLRALLHCVVHLLRACEQSA
jgi:CheY-like chemotaxis protein